VRRFLLAFGLVALLVAGAVSYLASSAPDGLDAVTRQGCTATEGGQLTGDCIAQDARSQPLAGGPLADYTIGGNRGLSGLAGVLGVAATLVLAGGLFRVLRQRPPAVSRGRSGPPGQG
jgi:cobalt/nickel transport protein